MANLLADPNQWLVGEDGPPPSQWNGSAYVVDGSPASYNGFYMYSMAQAAGDRVTGTFRYEFEGINEIPVYLLFIPTGQPVQYVQVTRGEDTAFDFEAFNGYQELSLSSSSEGGSLMSFYGLDVTVTPSGVAPAASYNCGCDCGYPTKTLDQLINDVAIGMGYSAQLAVLPASFRASVIFNLNMMQALVVSDLSEISNDRYFTWSVAAGETKFCPTENLETCRNLLLATRISEVYTVRDSGNIIERLAKGIPFKLHQAGDPQSFPSRYEVRSCIEIWPPPSEAMTLVAKGTLAAVDMVVGTDKCMVDPRALVMRTLAFMKGAKGHPDAGNWMGQYQSYIGDLCGSSHMDERYVPPSRRYEDWELEILTHVMQRRIYSDGSGS